MTSLHRFCLAAVTIVVALAVAVPAFGGPSLGQAARTARKALGLAKKADQRARTANSRALTASGRAGQALARANSVDAWVKALPVSGIGTAAGPQNTVGVGQAVSSIAFCPSGSRVISGGGFANTSEGVISSQANNTRTAWFVVTYEAVTPGTVQAVAYCAYTGRLLTARHASSTRREVEKLERAYLEHVR
jgi:hypothetical protein